MAHMLTSGDGRCQPKIWSTIANRAVREYDNGSLGGKHDPNS